MKVIPGGTKQEKDINKLDMYLLNILLKHSSFLYSLINI
jgi:hypothetical protein